MLRKNEGDRSPANTNITMTTTSSPTPSEYNFHPRFYQILNIPPSSLSKREAAYHLRNYLERSGAYVTSEDGQDEYIMMTHNVSLLSGINEGDTFAIKEAGQDRHSYAEFARIVLRRVVQARAT